MDNSIKIVNFDSKQTRDKKNEGLHEFLPKIPFSVCLVGPSGSGKTNLLLNLIKLYGHRFRPDDIILISPSISLDDKLDKIKSKWKFNSWDPQIIENLVDQQKTIKQHKPNKVPNLLVILDDCLQTNAFNHHSAIETAFVRLRHFNISLICSAQKYTGLSRTIRLNCKTLIIFEPYNQSEYDSILDENSDKYTRKPFHQMMLNIFSKPYAFLVINNMERNKLKRYNNSFEEYSAL